MLLIAVYCQGCHPAVQAADCVMMLPKVVEGGQVPACVPLSVMCSGCGLHPHRGRTSILSAERHGMACQYQLWPFSPCPPSRLCTSLKYCLKFPTVFGQAYHSSIILTLWLLKVPGSLHGSFCSARFLLLYLTLIYVIEKDKSILQLIQTFFHIDLKSLINTLWEYCFQPTVNPSHS